MLGLKRITNLSHIAPLGPEERIILYLFYYQTVNSQQSNHPAELFNADEYKDGIDSWIEIYGQDTIDTLVNSNAKLIYACIMCDLNKS